MLNMTEKKNLAEYITFEDNTRDLIEILAKFHPQSMVIKCLECNHNCGALFNLFFHYSKFHEDKIGKSVCGDKTLNGICVKTDCSFKDESGYSPSIDSSSNPRRGYTDPSSSPNPSSSSSSSPNLRSGYIDPNIDPGPNPKVITRCCNRCNYVKPLTDFDKSKNT